MKTAYLSLLHRSKRMPLQPSLKVNVPNAITHYFSVSIGLGLTSRGSRPQTTPPDAWIWIDLGCLGSFLYS